MKYCDMTDKELEKAIIDSHECGDAGGGLAYEAFRRYKETKEYLYYYDIDS